MRQRVKEMIEQRQMLQPGDRVMVGFSGGADSVALLSLLWELRDDWNIEVSACHVNHSLRGKESERDETFVRQFCKERKIPLEVRRIDAAAGAKLAGMSVELYSRQERYRIFEETAGDAKIATAHTLSDQVETVLFRLGRGAGLKGLEGIPPVRGRIIRPLIGCTRKEVEQFCRENGLNYVTDSTNLTDDYARNKIRHQVVPALEEVCPGLAGSVRRMTETARRDNSFLDRCAREAYNGLTDKTGGVRCQELAELDPALQYRAAGFLLEQAGAEISEKKRAEVLSLAGMGSGALEVRKGVRLICRGGLLTIEKEIPLEPPFFYSLARFQQRAAKLESLPEEGLSWTQEVCPGKIITILLVGYEKYKKFEKNVPDILKNSLDYDRIGDIAAVRQRKEGDSIRFFNRPHTRTLKKLMNEAKIPAGERGRRVVISDGQGPVWVEGFGSAKRAALSEESKRALIVTIREPAGR